MVSHYGTFSTVYYRFLVSSASFSLPSSPSLTIFLWSPISFFSLSLFIWLTSPSHGWGIPPNPSNAVSYLSLAARNSAAIESVALDAGLKKGGAAKGELVLAIYELANCYRMGLGVARDPVAARRYFETAARLGDLDAMEQTARCYEEGIGGKKNKFAAARYYRLAEQGGHNIVGNSW